jgi:monofunctional biosynthetic peptidoglycan transglycosylase
VACADETVAQLGEGSTELRQREVPLKARRAPMPIPRERIAVDLGRQPERFTVIAGSGAAVGTMDYAPERSGFRDYVRPALRFAFYAVSIWLGLIVVLMALYRFVNPPVSSLMLQQWLFGTEIQQSWVGLDRISPQIVRAVLVSEDGRFCQHRGVDLEAMQDAIENAGGGSLRGASTISMQVVKNLFLWPSKSYLRKAIELPLTGVLELFWPKQRIMEVYLNIAEWGPGIFGVEEASRYHFNKAASRLNEREAAQLAVALPNPYLRDAGDPGPKTRRLARDIQTRMRNAYPGQTACVLNARR